MTKENTNNIADILGTKTAFRMNFLGWSFRRNSIPDESGETLTIMNPDRTEVTSTDPDFLKTLAYVQTRDPYDDYYDSRGNRLPLTLSL